MGMTTRGSSITATANKSAITGSSWLHSRHDHIVGIWEKKRVELMKLFESNTMWLAEATAKLQEEQERKRAEMAEEKLKKPQKAAKKMPPPSAIKKNKTVVISPPSASVNEADASQTVKKRGRRKNSETAKSILSTPSTKQQPAPPPSTTTTIVPSTAKKPRGRPKKGRPSDSFQVKPADHSTPKTPRLPPFDEEVEIQSGKFSVKRTASIVISTVKRPLPPKAPIVESVAETAASVGVSSAEDRDRDRERDDRHVEDHHELDVIKHTVAEDEPFVERKNTITDSDGTRRNANTQPIVEPPKQIQQPMKPIEWVTVTQQEAAAASFLPSPAVFNVKANTNNTNNNNNNHVNSTKANVPLDDLPKVDSWTSQFALKPKQLQFDAVNVQSTYNNNNNNSTVNLKTPASKRTAQPPPSSSKKRRGLQLVDAPLPIAPAVTVLPAVGTTIKPAVPQFSTNNSNNNGLPIVNDTLPDESPLTKAKRLDSEYAQREQKLKAFLASGSDDIKRKLDGLRSTAVPVAKPANLTLAVPVPVVAVEKPTDIIKMLLEEPTRSSTSDGDGESQSTQSTLPAVSSKPTVISAPSQLPKPTAPRMSEREEASILHETPPLSITKMSAIDEPELQPQRTLSSSSSHGSLVMDSPAEPADSADHFATTQKSITAATKPSNDPRAAVEEQRKRLQERQNKAIERRKQLHEKAQAAKLPKEPSFIAKQPVSAKTSAVPKQLKEQQQPPQKTQALPMTPEAQKSYKLPLPKTRSPVVPMAQPNVPGKTAGTPESLPEIRSEEDPSTLKKKNVPNWAKTPNLVSALANQTTGLRPEDIFGDVQPIKLEDFFKGKKFSRSSTSGWNHHY